MLQQGNRPAPLKFGASWASSAGSGAGTSIQVFSAASNARGAILHRAAVHAMAATQAMGAFIANATSPVSLSGDVLAVTDAPTASGAYAHALKTEGDVFIPAGKGLFYYTPVAEASGIMRGALYTLL